MEKRCNCFKMEDVYDIFSPADMKFRNTKMRKSNIIEMRDNKTKITQANISHTSYTVTSNESIQSYVE